MARRHEAHWLNRIPHPRFLLFVMVSVAAALLLAHFGPADRVLILAFDAGALAFLLTCVPIWNEDHPDRQRARSARDDGGRAWRVLIAAAALGTVLLSLAQLVKARTSMSPVDFVTVVGTLILAWLFVNAVYAFHYAYLYYDQVDGTDAAGLEFPGDSAPVFSDFCYFAFVIGMTSQVSDVPINTRGLRRTATLHGLLAFFFNLGVLAMTINVLASVLGPG